ncbi:MAG: hypothetical protein AABX85_03090 [Nanoarchaeota archaeon]|mgnify:CR=1 FL=1
MGARKHNLELPVNLHSIVRRVSPSAINALEDVLARRAHNMNVAKAILLSVDYAVNRDFHFEDKKKVDDFTLASRLVDQSRELLSQNQPVYAHALIDLAQRVCIEPSCYGGRSVQVYHHHTDSQFAENLLYASGLDSDEEEFFLDASTDIAEKAYEGELVG